MSAEFWRNLNAIRRNWHHRGNIAPFGAWDDLCENHVENSVSRASGSICLETMQGWLKLNHFFSGSKRQRNTLPFGIFQNLPVIRARPLAKLQSFNLEKGQQFERSSKAETVPDFGPETLALRLKRRSLELH